MQNVLIVGATSAMAKSIARLWAQRTDRLYLLARNEAQLAVLAADLEVRGASSVDYARFEANDFLAHPECIDRAFECCGRIDVVLVCHGSLPDQQACERSVTTTLEALSTNGLSVVSLLTLVANHMERQGSGVIAVITSVAGDRGRQSNYVYGAVKGMVSVFLQGLRNRLYRKGVTVLDIKPGFVDTPMTAQFDKSKLWAQPADVATDILKAIDGKRDTLYTPWIWWWIMAIIRSVPEVIFKRLKL
jgi:decaprenylphospho-beta-D-erythro-pentofuranosid-2-ulose 2-reductase